MNIGVGIGPCDCSADVRTTTRSGGKRIIGEAGAGLENATWAANAAVAKIGRDGELRTADLLAEHRPSRTTVLHDLAIPIPGITANIDHAVVSGRTVVLIDTKAWKAGRYWTLFGTTRRGWAVFQHANTRTPAMGQDAIARFLAKRGIETNVVTPLIAVWPTSRSGRVKLGFLRMDRCHPLPAGKLPRRLRRVAGNHAADPSIVAALAELVNGLDPQGRNSKGSAVKDSALKGSARLPSPDWNTDHDSDCSDEDGAPSALGGHYVPPPPIIPKEPEVEVLPTLTRPPDLPAPERSSAFDSTPRDRRFRR